MNVKVGFIGCGKMASAIIKAIVDDSNYSIKGSEINSEVANTVQQRLNIEVITDNRILVRDSEIIFCAVKPNQLIPILDEVKDEINSNKLVISIAAGVSTKKIEKVLGAKRVIRVMPNTPALIKEGMFGICKGEYATNNDCIVVRNILEKIGKCIDVEESQMDIVTAISGSGPAFFYKVIEDMARAGEALGLDYDKSLLLATQTALGSAKMVFNRENVPVQTLIDNVATKGGCTFVGVEVMKEKNSENLFYEVINKTTKKAHELGE